MNSYALRGDGVTRVFHLPEPAASLASVVADGQPAAATLDGMRVVLAVAPARDALIEFTYTPGVYVPPVETVAVSSAPPVEFPSVQDVAVVAPVSLAAGQTVNIGTMPAVEVAMPTSLQVEPGASPLHVIVDNPSSGGGGTSSEVAVTSLPAVKVDPAQNTVKVENGGSALHVAVDSAPAVTIAAGQTVGLSNGTTVGVSSIPDVGVKAGQSIAISNSPDVGLKAGASVKVEPGTAPVHVVVDSAPAATPAIPTTPTTLFNGSYPSTGATVYYTAEMDTYGASQALVYITSSGATMTYYPQYKDPVTGNWYDLTIASTATFQVNATNGLAQAFRISPSVTSAAGQVSSMVPAKLRLRCIVNSGTGLASTVAVSLYP